VTAQKLLTIKSLVKLIVFIVITAILTTVLAFTIGKVSFENGRTYHAVFTDATNVTSSSDVRMAGVKVGQVESVKTVRVHDHGGSAHTYADVTFDVKSKLPVRKSAIARVRYLNLIGERYVEIDEGAGSSERMPAGATIPVTQTQPALDLTALFDGFRPLFRGLSPKQVNRLSMEIVKTLQGEGGTIDTLLGHVASLSKTVADRDAVVGQVVTNLNTVLATVDKHDAGLKELIDQLQRLVTGLAGDRHAIASSLGNINHLASSTAGLLKKIRPPLPGDLTRLTKLADTLATTKYPHSKVNVLDEFLGRIPNKLNAIDRTAHYGSWFNFYLCAFNGNIQLPGPLAKLLGLTQNATQAANLPIRAPGGGPIILGNHSNEPACVGTEPGGSGTGPPSGGGS
jgi:phospholipid/cholesterol/gamma-HCH transport system substrate-binding protein